MRHLISPRHLESMLTARFVTHLLRCALFAALALPTLFFSLIAHGQEIDRVMFPERADHLLASYNVSHEMIAIDDSTPLVRIYGDGRVLVHRPSYMKDSGDFEFELSQDELQALCQEFVRHRIMSFSEQNARAEMRAQQIAGGRQYAISDSSRVEIEFQPRAMRLARSRRVEPVGGRRHRVVNPRAHARMFPALQPYGDIAAIESIFMRLLYADRLMRIR